jgi:hypothetical protein
MDSSNDPKSDTPMAGSTTSQHPRRRRARSDDHHHELLREAATMVLYVSVVEIAELAALPESRSGHGVVTGPAGTELLAIVWGTALGLALAHWFAFGVAAHGFRGDRPTGHDVRVGLVQVGAAIAVAAVSSLPVLLLSRAEARDTTGDVPAVIIGALAYVLARAAGNSRLAAAFLAVTALALGVLVALVKTRLAAH